MKRVRCGGTRDASARTSCSRNRWKTLMRFARRGAIRDASARPHVCLGERAGPFVIS